MKIWQSYGAEHSLNLVVIGRFKEVVDAEEFTYLTNLITKLLSSKDNFDFDSPRFDSDVSDFLSRENIYCLSPYQLGHFLMDMNIEQEGNEVRISSDDDINGLISFMLHKGAKIEIFSAHDYPESNKEEDKDD